MSSWLVNDAVGATFEVEADEAVVANDFVVFYQNTDLRFSDCLAVRIVLKPHSVKLVRLDPPPPRAESIENE